MKKKSLSAKKITPKNFDFIKILKNKKIYEIFKTFVSNYKNFDKSKKIAVAVSEPIVWLCVF